MTDDAGLERARPRRVSKAVPSLVLLLCAWATLAGQYEDGEVAARRGDYVTAFQLLGPLANQGEVRAQFMLGTLYEQGKGVTRNLAEAAKWYRLAADQGDVLCQLVIADMTREGKGIEKNLLEAYKWYSLVVSGAARDAYGGLMAMQALNRRDAMSMDMSTDEIFRARKLVEEWNAARPGSTGARDQQDGE